VPDDDAGLAWEILQRYDDPATAEFDAALAAADIPAETARVLRFWQRESLASTKQFAAEALPQVFTAIARAQADAAEATHRAARALTAENDPRSAGTPAWGTAVPDLVITLPDAARNSGTTRSLEERRRTVAARLADLG
jgi:hypothetical protein